MGNVALKSKRMKRSTSWAKHKEKEREMTREDNSSISKGEDNDKMVVAQLQFYNLEYGIHRWFFSLIDQIRSRISCFFLVFCFPRRASLTLLATKTCPSFPRNSILD
jgi:hypothetical protein